MSLLTSDVREEYIQLRIPGGARMVDVDVWSENVALDLYPAATNIFPRHRWCNSLQTVQSFALLANVHDILRRAGLLWLTGKQMYKNPRQFAVAIVDGDSIASKHLVLSDDEDGLEGQILVCALGPG